VTEGGEDSEGRYHHLASFQDNLLAELIRNVYEVDPLLCPRYDGQMRIIAFLTDYAVVDRIIKHLKLTFVVERPRPPKMVSQEFFLDSEASADYFS